MSKEDNGGPAFARPFGHDTFNEETMLAQSGMSLRDYFAARMMVYHLAQQTGPHQKHHYMNAAMGAYEMSDAMLEARKK